MLILILLASFYIFQTGYTAKMYYQEANQKLNKDVAAHIAKFMSPFVNDAINQDSVEQMFHNVMVLNPSVEVYLLDEKGVILSYYAPNKQIRVDRLSLSPIRSFVEQEGQELVLGQDPRNPALKKVFSAAPIVNSGRTVGYVYVILASEEYDSVTAFLFGSYFLSLGITSILITLLAALIIGLIIFYTLTRNLNLIVRTVKKFEHGDFNVRIPIKSKGEFGGLANTFNEMASTIAQNIEELKSVEKLRRELVANISHDLRTPLTTIHGYTETILMKDGALQKEVRLKYMTIVLKTTKKLIKLVEELFELSKFEANQVKPYPESFFINELIQDVVQKFQMMAMAKKIQFAVELPQHALVYADISLIDRVLQNLIENALKYTSEGGRITLELRKLGKNVEVCISDTGTGIPEDLLPFIFDKYHPSKVAPYTTDGAGLGLSIVKRILDLHQSEIKVASKVDAGSSFSFYLPIFMH